MDSVAEPKKFFPPAPDPEIFFSRGSGSPTLVMVKSPQQTKPIVNQRDSDNKSLQWTKNNNKKVTVIYPAPLLTTNHLTKNIKQEERRQNTLQLY